MKSLKIADNLSLPLDAVTRRMAILAMSGAGKSNTAVVLAEAMFDAGIPWVAIDPKGDWWGIRSSGNGKGSGLPIPIFGGLHGDLQIDATPAAGKELAEAIVEYRLTCVVDVSEFADRQSMWGFLAAFGETLLHRNRQALHLFLEEADEYLPQSTRDKGNLPKCLGVWQRVVKRGRFRGLGSTQISQRSAALNKDTLYMAEALIAMRATGKGDRDAIKGWVEYNNAANEIVASLPGLADGEGWFSSPAWLRETQRVRFLRRRTFDSGSTPVLVDGKGSSPATLADVDLTALQKKMSAAIEKAKSTDPQLLKKRVSELECELRKKTPASVDPEALARARTEGERAAERRLQPHIDKLTKTIAAALKTLHSVNGFQNLPPNPPHESRPIVREAAPPKPPSPPARQRTGDAPPDGQKLSGGERKILTVLAQYPQGRTDSQVAILTGYAAGTGGFNNYLGALRSKGWIEGGRGGPLRIAEAGLEALGGEYDPLPTGRALLEQWLGKLGKAERRVLQALAESFPRTLTDEEVADLTGYTAGTGGFNNALGRLRTLELIVGSKNELKASEDLF